MCAEPTSTVFLTRKLWQRQSFTSQGEKKGLDVSGMTGMDFQAFKETQYDILAASFGSIWI